MKGDHSFKAWFTIMAIKNAYFWLFLVAIAAIIWMYVTRDQFESINHFWISVSIPAAMIVVIVFGAFIQFWRYLTGKKK